MDTNLDIDMETLRIDVDLQGYRRDGRGSPGLVAPGRAVLCARQSRSMAAQLVALDSV